MRDRDKARGRQLRTELAETAARLLAEGAASGFHAARMKAAERLGVADARCHPSNQEIEAALAAYQRLFQADRHDTQLRGLRRTAVEAMDWLEEFQPRLVGPVLSGTASVTTPVTLHVFADEAEAVALFLLNGDVPFELQERRLRGPSGATLCQPAYCFLAGDSRVELIVFPRQGIRQAPASPVDGRPMPRADRAAVEALLTGDGPDTRVEPGGF